MRNKRYLHLFFYIIFLGFYSQNIYTQKTYYMVDYQLTKDMGGKFKSILILGNSAIDPSNSGKIDIKLFERKLKSLIPNDKSDDILCIDLENKIYQDLKNNNLNTSLVENSVNEFVSLIKLVRRIRPNVKVGIYALPFTTYYKTQFVRNQRGKFDKIFEKVDYIFPSIYIYYPAIQSGLQANFNYFNQNLNEAILYAKKYKKEIIPFFGYLVHTSNKKYSNAMLDKEEMKLYIDYLWNYSESKFMFKGIVIWNSSTPFTQDKINTSLLKNKDKYFKNSTEVINYYQSIL